MPKLTIDGEEIEVEAGMTVLQACEAAGKEIPRFCFHERLSIAGNCRMCLVGMERSPKPVASCAMPAGDGMVVYTDTPEVRKMRKGVMEFLLINHPLDCPICDQGGECDLQDQAMGYGVGTSRFAENKRSVKDKYMGPLIKTIMTRCIHCTRCIRFATEIAGVPELGATGRGENMEVGTYVESALSSELSGNMIDLCPVGALTSKPYAYNARPWELRKTESVDVTDAVGSNIRVDVRGDAVLRVLPRLNEDVNEEWISDKARFSCDGLGRQRLDRPYVRRDGKLHPASWDEAFAAVADALNGKSGDAVGALAGDLTDAESMFAMKELLSKLGSANMDCRTDGAAIDPGCRAGYLFNTTIAGIEQADACLIVGSNPRVEAAVLNARLRKRWSLREFPVGLIGEAADLTFPYEHLGDGPSTLEQVAAGKHPFAKVLKDAERPMLIVGQGALMRPDGAAVLALARTVAEKTGMVGGTDGWNGFNMLHTAAARVAGLDLGFVPGADAKGAAEILSGACDVVWLLGVDEADLSGLADTFVIYQGHHGDAGAHAADVILPGAAYTEKSGTYLNTEGRPQITRLAAHPPGEAREDWTIIRAFSGHIGQTLSYDSLGDLRAHMAKAAPHLLGLDIVTEAAWGDFGTPGAVDGAPFVSPVRNFYMTDPIGRASQTMADCAALFLGDGRKTGTDG
jgi:NADH-quinone oxidoreductase subunit G